MDRKKFFVHLRIDDGAATLAVVGDHVGVALCSPREQFSRAIGRAIATGRAAARKGLSFPLPPRSKDDPPLNVAVMREFEKQLRRGLGSDVRWLDNGLDTGPHWVRPWRLP